jgi:hypothetical protein
MVGVLDPVGIQHALVETVDSESWDPDPLLCFPAGWRFTLLPRWDRICKRPRSVASDSARLWVERDQNAIIFRCAPVLLPYVTSDREGERSVTSVEALAETFVLGEDRPDL